MKNGWRTGNIRPAAAWLLLLFLAVALLAAAIYYLGDYGEGEPRPETASRTSDQGDSRQPAVDTPGPETVYAASDKLAVSEVITGLDIPWDVAFTPDGVMLVNERAGGLTARLANGSLRPVEADFSDLDIRHELGLMGMAVDPAFSANRRFYTCQGERESGRIEVVAWRISDDYARAERVDDPLVGGIPSANIHNGCRLRFGGEGYLWISTGDAARGSNPQDLNSLAGKILRVEAAMGRAAPGNPFSGSERAGLVYTFGHRNPQGLAWRPGFRQMWAVEHGPDVDDEINLLTAGGNYGWDPVSSLSGYDQRVPMTDTEKYPAAVEAGWSSGDPTLATSGAIFLEGKHWGGKEGWLAVATLKDSSLHLFDFDEAGNFKSRFSPPELDGAYGRLRTPMMGPDGALYITTSNGNGEDSVLRLVPEPPNRAVDSH